MEPFLASVLSTPATTMLRLLSLIGVALAGFPVVASPQDVHVPGDFPTIQEGLDNVGSGCTVWVDPGIYIESLVIDPGGHLGAPHGSFGIRIAGAYPGVVVKWAEGAHSLPSPATTALGEPIDYVLLVYGAHGIELENLELAGADDITPGMRSGGIFVLDSSVTITGCFVHGFRESPTGSAANGIGIQVEGASSVVGLVNCTLVNNQEGQVAALAGATVDLTACGLIGRGPTSSLAQYGVRYGRAGIEANGTGIVDGCILEGFWYTGATSRAVGIVSEDGGPGLEVRDSALIDCQTGVRVTADPASITATIVGSYFTQLSTVASGLPPAGLIVEDGDAGNAFAIEDCRFRGHDGPGIALLTDGGTIENCYLDRNGTTSGDNCRDDASPTGNDWTANTYSDFATNPGWPDHYLVPGLAGALDDGALEPGAIVLYGSVNPPGSLVVLSGRSAIGTSFEIGIDNPLGSQAVGSLALYLMSCAPDPNYPDGTLLPGHGMDPSLGYGELLISLRDLDDSLARWGIWSGPGSPFRCTVHLPDDPRLVGRTVYTQGAILDTVSQGEPWVGLTTGAELRIGY